MSNIVSASREDFEIFCKYMKKGFESSLHHKKMISACTQIKNSKISRAIITCPPQKGKSTIFSELFPVFMLANNPELRIIVSSYSAELASKFCRAARELINSDNFKALFPNLKLKKDLDRQDYFGFEGHSGYYRSVGVGGSLTGYSADILIVDDPHKDRIDSESKKSRDGVYDWFTSVALTRLSVTGKIIVIQTRWHEDDLSGRLLENHTYKHLWIKAINDDNTVCWPERYTLDDYLRVKQEVGSRDFSALYQGEPNNSEVGLFKNDWFEYYRESPVLTKWVRAWDIASSKKNSSDYSVGALVTQDKSGNIFIEDIVKYQLEFPELLQQIVEQAELDGPEVHILIEAVGVGLPAFQEVMRRLPGYVVRKSDVKGDKTQRAYVWSSRAEVGKVSLRKAKWNDDFINECVSFPKGKHDDMVDAVSASVNYLAGKITAISEPRICRPGTPEYYSALVPVSRAKSKFRKTI